MVNAGMGISAGHSRGDTAIQSAKSNDGERRLEADPNSAGPHIFFRRAAPVIGRDLFCSGHLEASGDVF